MRLTLALGLFLQLGAAVCSAQDFRLPAAAAPRVEGDVVQTFGCRMGSGVIGNARKINAALLNRANLYSMLIPAGQLEISEPIYWPARTGGSLLGVGSSKDLPDSAYSGDGIGGQASRLVWRSAGKVTTSETMLSYSGLGGTIERIHFQGRPVTGKLSAEGEAAGGSALVQQYRKALVGIQVNTLQSGGSALNSGKVAIRDCSFGQLQTGILFASSMEAPDGDPTVDFAGSTDSNADESSVSNLRFGYPYDDNPSGEHRTCFRFRTNQSVGFDGSGIRVNGNPNEIFYFERGGRFVCTSAMLSGASSKTNPVTVLRIGKTSGNSAWYNVNCSIDGGAGGSGGIGSNFRLIQMDTSRTGNVYVEYSGVIGPVSYATPIVVARGACTIVLHGVFGLNPKTLQLIGNVIGRDETRVCNVHLEGCTLRGCDWPSDLVTAANDAAAPSNGPWRLTWSNCSRISAAANSQGYAIPFADSTAATALESKDVSPRTIKGP